MDINELRALVAVADLGSVKAASASLGWARGTVRRRLDSLEARVGKELLIRDERGARLTDAGRTVASHARRLISDANAMMRAARADQEPSGTIRVRVFVGLPPEPHAQFALMLRDQMPGVKLKMHLAEDPLDEPLAPYDALVHFGPHTPGDEWHTVPFSDVRERLFASREYLERHPAPTSVEELEGHRLIVWRAPGETGEVWRTPDGGAVAVSPAVVTPSVFHAMHYISAGVGIGFVPDGGLRTTGVEPETYVEVLPGQVGGTRRVLFSFRKSMQHDVGIQAFWELCVTLATQGGVPVAS